MGRQMSKHLRMICPGVRKCIYMTQVFLGGVLYYKEEEKNTFLSIYCDVDLYWLKAGFDLILAAQMSKRCVFPQAGFYTQSLLTLAVILKSLS